MTEEHKNDTLQHRLLSDLQPVAPAISLDRRKKQKRTAQSHLGKNTKSGGSDPTRHANPCRRFFPRANPVQNKKPQTKEATNAHRKEGSRHYNP
jgi:hypothetical protein